MTRHVILTAIGADRPGLVDEVSHFIFERGGNIEDSRMVNLRGQFAIMVLVGGSDEAVASIEKSLGALTEKTALHAQTRAAGQSPAGAAAGGLTYRLTASAMDRAGLVHRIAHLLRTLNVNIESLQTRLRPAPISGAPLFELDLVMSVPREVAIAALRRQVGALCDELNVDWQISTL